MIEQQTKLYRYEDFYYDTVIRVELIECDIINYTPCGAWIWYYGKKKFVNFNWRKAPAYKTKKEALESFIYRKQRYLAILEAKINQAKIALQIAETGNLHEPVKYTTNIAKVLFK
jgi:hypothetical protein